MSAFILVHEQARRNALDAVQNAPQGYRVTVKPSTRSLDQNAALWAKLGEIAAQVEWHGRMLDAESWKHIFSSSLKRQDVVPNLDGTGFVVMGVSTSRMTKAEMSELLELIAAFGAATQREIWRRTRPIRNPMNSPMQVVPEALLGAIARGWCAPENSRKPLDSDLAYAIGREVAAYLASPTAPPVAPPTVVVDTDEFLQLIERFAHEASCEEFNDAEYKTARTALIAHITALIEAARVEGRRDMHETNVALLGQNLRLLEQLATSATVREVGEDALTEKQISAGARYMCNSDADACNVDKEDNWKIYGQEYIEEFKAAIDAAIKAGGK
jgi:hypothetical protein